MRIKNALLWQDYTPYQALIGTVFITLTAFGLRYILHPIIEPYAVFHFFIVGCLSIQYLFGYKFSVPSMVVATVLAEYYFIAPYGEFNSLGRKDLVIALNFLMVTAVAIIFMEKLRRAAYAQELLLKVMDSRHKVSLQRENDRLFYARKSSEVWAILEEVILDHEKTLFYQYGDDCKIAPLFYRLATRFTLKTPTNEWEIGLSTQDVPVLKKRLMDDQDNSVFEIGLIQSDGSEKRVAVAIDRFHFLGKRFQLVKVAAARS